MKKRLLIISGLLMLQFGCASAPKHPAITFDHQDRQTRASFNDLTALEIENKLGPAVIKGHDTLEGEDARLIYRLVYVQVDQGPIMIEDLKKLMAKNTDTGIKCMSFNFSKANDYKFKSAIAPLSWDNDCSYYKNIKE